MSIRVRPAAESDADGIGALTVQAYNAGAHLPVGHPYEDVLRDVAPRLEQTLVAEPVASDRTTIVGSLTVLDSGHTMTELARPGEAEIRFVAVDPQSWGQGIADDLMDAGEQRSWDRGIERLVLYVYEPNTRARRFYERRGFYRLPDRDMTLTGSDGTPVHLLAFCKTRPA